MKELYLFCFLKNKKGQKLKTLILAVICCAAFSSVIYSQDRMASKPDFKDEYWKISFIAGSSVQLHETIDELSKAVLPGYNAGIELSYCFEKIKTEAVASVLFSSFTNRLPNIGPAQEIGERSIRYFEVTLGPKFYLGNSYFLQVAIGNYINSFRTKYFYNTEVYSGYGFNIGGGKRINLTKQIDLNLAGKMHMSFPESGKILFVTLDAGLTLKDNNSKPQPVSGSAVAIYAGIVQPEFLVSDKFYVSDFLSLEYAFKRSNWQEININLCLNHFRYEREYYYKIDDIVLECTAGPRFIIGNGSTKGFVGFGGGIYFYNSKKADSDTYFGTNAGVGLMQHLSGKLSILFKSNLNVLISPDSQSPYVNAGAGLRWDF
jgi:hypothetical protein